jgi:AcrR family transcriptional regulator
VKAPLDEPSDHHGESHTLWFNAPMADGQRRPPLTRERVVAEALTVIAQDGVAALTMRTLATRLGVVPGALYRHMRNKEQLQDLVLDGVLAEVDCDVDASLAWTEQITVLAHRLREVLEGHPGVAGLLQLRDPLGPHSLTVAEAFLGPLQAAGFGDHQAGQAFFLVIDYTPALRPAAHPSPSTSSASATKPREASSTSSSARYPPTASPHWSPLASMSGSTTATSGSPPAWTCSSTGCSGHGARPTGGRSAGDRPQPPAASDHLKLRGRR